MCQPARLGLNHIPSNILNYIPESSKVLTLPGGGGGGRCHTSPYVFLPKKLMLKCDVSPALKKLEKSSSLGGGGGGGDTTHTHTHKIRP